MQKAAVGFDRAKEDARELEEERKRAERAEQEGAQHAESLKDAREEVESLKGENAELKRKADEVERELRQELAAAKAKAEAEYDRAVVVITDNYTAQMPAVQDAVWSMAWQRCLTKLGVDPSSPHWTNMELPSEAAASQVNSDAGAQPDPEACPEPQAEQILRDETVNTSTSLGNESTEGLGDVNPDPNLAADAGQHSEEA
jgi:hypothetical protein